jgi:pyridoxal 5'-phosphate synthase pdxT subunit
VTARFGVLALQGDFAAHAAALGSAGADVREVRHVGELEGLAGLVIPGGESTTLLNLMGDEPWFEALKALHTAGGALFGTCAGAIVLAREVRPAQPSLGLLDVVVERNAFGRQAESFEMRIETAGVGPTEAVFIRAPRIRWVGPGVQTLASIDGEPVCVRSGRVLAATFHPELTGSSALHRLFVGMVGPIDTARCA